MIWKINDYPSCGHVKQGLRNALENYSPVDAAAEAGCLPMRMAPTKRTISYVLLLEVLKRAKKVGVARLVMRDKEYLALIRPVNQVLVLHTIPG